MNSLKNHTIIGIFFVLTAGTISHFLYKWTGGNFIIGLFVPVNESTWEHMKLLFFPMLLYSFFMIRKHEKSCPCIAPAVAFGILAGTLLIPAIFYTYTGILGYHVFLLDLGTFLLSVLIAFYSAYKLTLSCKMQEHKFFLYSLIFIFIICFLWFTCSPPSIGLFRTYPSVPQRPASFLQSSSC